MLLNCVVYRQGLKVADIGVGEIASHLADADAFVWVALRNASDEELVAVQREFGLHELAVEDARHGHQRPKIEEYGDMVFTVMHLVEFGPTDDLAVARSRSSSARTTWSRCATAAARASSACASAANVNRTCCARVPASSSTR